MSDPQLFDTASPRFGLPLLFAGQSQKEAFVNEAHSLIDALLHCTIEDTAAAPPITVADGANWLVDQGATGDWLGKDGMLACRQSGNWLFIAPRDGIRIVNRANGQTITYLNGWQAPASPALPQGGNVIDAEARTALANLVTALALAGLFPNE